MANKGFDCLVVGVGGQGVVLASRLVAAAFMNGGAYVRTAETIGMSQRGGGVATHVRATAADEGASQLSCGICAGEPQGAATSLIPSRSADLVLAFEPGEAVRAYGFLAPAGSMVCANRPVVPSAAASGGYDGQAQIAWLRKSVAPGRIAVVDVSALERSGLNPKCLNVMLLGAAVGLGALPFGADELRQAMTQLMKPQLIEMNERALALGIELARS